MSFTWGALGKLFPNSFANQMWGMVMFDFAAMCWALAFVFKSNSVGQYTTRPGSGSLWLSWEPCLWWQRKSSWAGRRSYRITTWGNILVYGFVIVTAVHAALVYFHHASAPDIHEKINIEIAHGEITTEAIRQANSTSGSTESDVSAIHSVRNIVDKGQAGFEYSDCSRSERRFCPRQYPTGNSPLPRPGPEEKNIIGLTGTRIRLLPNRKRLPRN